MFEHVGARNARLSVAFGNVPVLRVLFLAVLLLAAFAPARPAHAITPQNECSNSYDANKSFCVDVVRDDWRYWIAVSPLVPQGPFTSEADAIAGIVPYFVDGTPAAWCTMTPTGSVVRDTATPKFTYGIDTTHYHTVVTYNITAFNNTNCVTHFTRDGIIQQIRGVHCPAPLNNGTWSWTLVYEAGNPATPYCAM